MKKVKLLMLFTLNSSLYLQHCFATSFGKRNMAAQPENTADTTSDSGSENITAVAPKIGGRTNTLTRKIPLRSMENVSHHLTRPMPVMPYTNGYWMVSPSTPSE